MALNKIFMPISRSLKLNFAEKSHSPVLDRPLAGPSGRGLHSSTPAMRQHGDFKTLFHGESAVSAEVRYLHHIRRIRQTQAPKSRMTHQRSTPRGSLDGSWPKAVSCRHCQYRLRNRPRYRMASNAKPSKPVIPCRSVFSMP